MNAARDGSTLKSRFARSIFSIPAAAKLRSQMSTALTGSTNVAWARARCAGIVPFTRAPPPATPRITLTDRQPRLTGGSDRANGGQPVHPSPRAPRKCRQFPALRCDRLRQNAAIIARHSASARAKRRRDIVRRRSMLADGRGSPIIDRGEAEPAPIASSG